MEKQQVIDVFKTELSKTYTIRTTTYENGKVIDTTDTHYPNSYLNFDRSIIEAALAYLEE